MSGGRKLHSDAVYLGVTRPPMRWGVTYAALLVNLVITMELFLTTQNLLMLLVALPIHALSVLLCARDERIFELLALWLRTHLITRLATHSLWRSASYGPMPFSLPRLNGRRPGNVEPHVVL